jgi:LacI family transcriptional regulator
VTNDTLAYLIAWVLRRSGFSIPERISLLGVGNSPEFTLYGNVPISSITLNSYERGFRAMQLGSRIIEKKSNDSLLIKTPPVGVVERESTKGEDWSDPLISKALSFIRENSAAPIEVQDVAHAVGLSKRTLERKFQAECKSSPKKEISRERLRRCASLLTTTNWKIAEIADACGFTDYRHMGTAYRKAFSESPEAYRRRMRSAATSTINPAPDSP